MLKGAVATKTRVGSSAGFCFHSRRNMRVISFFNANIITTSVRNYTLIMRNYVLYGRKYVHSIHPTSILALNGCLRMRFAAIKVLLSLCIESTNYWLPIIHSLGFCAEEGHPVSLRYSKKEFESNDILIHFVEFSNVHNSDRISNVTQSNL